MNIAKRAVMVLALIFVAGALTFWGASSVWKATRQLSEIQVIALAERYYALTSRCEGPLAATAQPPAMWRADTWWRVTVAGPCDLKTFLVDDATSAVGLIRPTATEAQIRQEALGGAMSKAEFNAFLRGLR